MPLTTLTRLRDELVNLYGEDKIALFGLLTVRKLIKEWLDNGVTKRHNMLSFGSSLPTASKPFANYSVTFGEMLAKIDIEGQQTRSARARLLVSAYALWDSDYRPIIRKECGEAHIKSDVFGDLRLYRNAILHQKGKLDDDTKVLKVFRKGDIIEPTANQLREVFEQLITGLNDLGIRYYGLNPGFEWGRIPYHRRGNNPAINDK